MPFGFDLAGLARRQRLAVLVRDTDRHHALRSADRSQPFQITRMAGLHVPFAAERGDRHRRFALAVNLHEALAHHRNGLANVCEIHRPAAIDDGADAFAVFAAAFGGIDQSADHGRCAKHHDIVELTGEIEHFIRIESAGFRDDVSPAHAGMGEVIKARAMRDRRGIERGIVRRRRIDIDEIARRRRDQIAVAEHDAFRPPRGARRIEQPGEVIDVALKRRRCPLTFAHRPIRLAIERDQLDRRRQFGFCFHQRRGRVVRDEDELRAGIAADPGGFAAM